MSGAPAELSKKCALTSGKCSRGNWLACELAHHMQHEKHCVFGQATSLMGQRATFNDVLFS